MLIERKWHTACASWQGAVAHLDVSASTWYADGSMFDDDVRQHSFVEIGHEIFSTAIFSLPLFQLLMSNAKIWPHFVNLSQKLYLSYEVTSERVIKLCSKNNKLGPDPDLSVLGGLKLGEGSRGPLRPLCGSRAKLWWGVLGGEAPRRKTIFCVWVAFGGHSLIAFCEFLAVFFVSDCRFGVSPVTILILITKNTLKFSYDHVTDIEVFLNHENE